jgi:uncharacterized protein YndB with AHSA1/START domain
MQIILNETIQAAPTEVYRAFTNATLLGQWLANNAKILGRAFLLHWNTGYYASGEFTALEPHTRITFTWQGQHDPAKTDVEVLLTLEGDGTRLQLTHTIPDGESAHFERDWRDALDSLKAALERGEDLRLMRRPMVGLFPAVLEAARAAKLGVPMTQGIVVEGVVEGLSAQQAGLQKDDVIVELDGKPVTDYSSFQGAITGHKAGDTVQAVFYRGSDKHTVDLTFSPRVMPAAPATPAALVEELRTQHETLNAELDTLLTDVPETVLAARPEETEWSVNENLAHLIWSERHTQMTIWGLAGYNDEFAWPNNGAIHLAGALAVHGTAAALAEALKREEQATVAIIESLPPSVMENKLNFWRLAQTALGLLPHTREHLTQMREAIQAVRAKAATA